MQLDAVLKSCRYMLQAEELKKQGISVIACAAVTSPKQLASWAEKAGNDGNTVMPLTLSHDRQFLQRIMMFDVWTSSRARVISDA